MRLPGARNKNGKPHDIVVGASGRDPSGARRRQDGRDSVFGTNGSGFCDFSGSRADLDQRVGGAIAERWTLQDFRRTISTRLHGAPFAIAPHVVEALSATWAAIAPASPERIIGRDYLLERRAALTRWAEQIEEIAGGTDRAIAASGLVPLRRLLPRKPAADR